MILETPVYSIYGVVFGGSNSIGDAWMRGCLDEWMRALAAALLHVGATKAKAKAGFPAGIIR